jgi:hypothetical protein
MIPGEVGNPIEDATDTLLGLLPDEAPRDMLRPLIFNNVGLMYATQGPETVASLVDGMREAKRCADAGDLAGAESALQRFGLSFGMLESMAGMS